MDKFIELDLLKDIIDVVSLLRHQKYLYAMRKFTLLVDSLNDLIANCMENKIEICGSDTGVVIWRELFDVIKKLFFMQQKKDYVALSDILEYEMIPILLRIQNGCIKNNIVLEQKGYRVEKTTLGMNTLVTEYNGEWCYLHSARDPYTEAKCLAETWFDEHYYDYIVFGMGLGYHVEALLEMDETVSVMVFEYDKNIIELARNYGVLGKLEKSKRVTVISYTSWEELNDEKVFNDRNKRIVMHYPSIKKIKNEILKNHLEDYFILSNSYETHKIRMIGNFKKNQKEFDHEVTELAGSFIGKNIFIIAAGPSLDKNISLLKIKPPGSVIVATGTVLKKMLAIDIIPDYVIITDAGVATYSQIEGIGRNDIPLLYLSTVYYKIPHDYLGSKYFICQEGFFKAEEYAKKQKFPLYETGGSVTTTALDICIRMKCKRVIFIGLDLAYTDMKTHATGTAYECNGQFGNMQTLDIDGGMIYTAKNLNLYRKWIENRICSKDAQEIEFVDATEGGALITGTNINNLENTIKKLVEESS